MKKNQISNPAISNGENEKNSKKKASQTCHGQTCVREEAHSRRFKWQE